MKKILLTLIILVASINAKCFYNPTSPTNIAIHSVLNNAVLNSANRSHKDTTYTLDSMSYNVDTLLTPKQIGQPKDKAINLFYACVFIAFVLLILKIILS